MHLCAAPVHRGHTFSFSSKSRSFRRGTSPPALLTSRCTLASCPCILVSRIGFWACVWEPRGRRLTVYPVRQDLDYPLLENREEWVAHGFSYQVSSSSDQPLRLRSAPPLLTPCRRLPPNHPELSRCVCRASPQNYLTELGYNISNVTGLGIYGRSSVDRLLPFRC
jgi:hypothetical protein